MEIHIGSMIRLRAKELRIGPTELGSKINTSKQNVYGIYKRRSIDTRLLVKICVALDYDFFKYYTKSLLLSEAPSNESDSVEARKQLDVCRSESDALQRENDYLKKINGLLEDKVARLRGES
jgi:hypothetical protein